MKPTEETVCWKKALALVAVEPSQKKQPLHTGEKEQALDLN